MELQNSRFQKIDVEERARNIYRELLVFPDDVHETRLHSRWLYAFARMEAFLKIFFGV
jgi:hypothetical protein